MAWQDRIRQAAYNSPSGIRLTFDFEDVRKAVDKKTTAFEFPDADGTFIQDLGHTGRRYPMRLFFWGDDYDTEAAAFEAALLEVGPGRLEHPVYGVVDVVPFGTITQRDDLKTAANQAIIEVTFWQTIRDLYPLAQGDPASAVLTAVAEFNTTAAGEFADILDLDTAFKRATVENSVIGLLDATKSGLQAIADVQDDVRQQFDAISDSITSSIDILIGEPLALGFQITQLVQAPARALTNIQARLDSYAELATAVISGEGAVDSNEFHTRDIYASTYVTGSVVSVVNNQFVTKPDALEAAEAVLAQFEAVAAWRDDNFQTLEQVDTGGSYQQLQEAVAITVGFLVEISFSLKQERRIVLDRPRTYIDVVAEFYGETDAQFDFFIASNDLSGDEFIELPRGREIVVYV